MNKRMKGRRKPPYFSMVRMRGLEPPRCYSPDPKSGASANSATSAFSVQEILYLPVWIISTVILEHIDNLINSRFLVHIIILSGLEGKKEIFKK